VFKACLEIVYMSGYLKFGDRSRDFQEGGFLQKPFSRDSLVAKLNEAFKATGINFCV
jgi:two-component SAPR family response regulator